MSGSANSINMKELVDGVNTLLRGSARKFSLGSLKIAENGIVNSEKELQEKLMLFLKADDAPVSWIMFSDRIVRNQAPSALDAASLLKLQEAEFYSAKKQTTVRVKRTGTGHFALAVYENDGSEGGQKLPCRTQSICVRQDIASRDRLSRRIVYTLWYRPSDTERGRIVPYVQQFTGFEEEE
ncbi:MAG: hypothetical protein IJ523_11240 [Succinivibrionaceae bacterium]|nr:hypothetical protein [Succinivibrionaceae bacterium]